MPLNRQLRSLIVPLALITVLIGIPVTLMEILRDPRPDVVSHRVWIHNVDDVRCSFETLATAEEIHQALRAAQRDGGWIAVRRGGTFHDQITTLRGSSIVGWDIDRQPMRPTRAESTIWGGIDPVASPSEPPRTLVTTH